MVVVLVGFMGGRQDHGEAHHGRTARPALRGQRRADRTAPRPRHPRHLPHRGGAVLPPARARHGGRPGPRAGRGDRAGRRRGRGPADPGGAARHKGRVPAGRLRRGDGAGQERRVPADAAPARPGRGVQTAAAGLRGALGAHRRHRRPPPRRRRARGARPAHPAARDPARQLAAGEPRRRLAGPRGHGQLPARTASRNRRTRSETGVGGFGAAVARADEQADQRAG
jgi:hypothetical protein